MSRVLEDVEVVNKHRLALAEVFKTVRASVPAPAPGPVLRVSDSGHLTTNRGKTVREAATPPQKEGK